MAFIVLVLEIIRRLWTTTLRQLRANRRYGPYCAGLFAFFVANIASLTVSGQILADPFIAAWLGILVGLLLGMERLPDDPQVDRYARVRQQQTPRSGSAYGWQGR